MSEMNKLKKGDIAPDFDLPDQEGKRVKLSDLRGTRILLYFYPKADTPGCTTQSCAVSASMGDLKKSNVIALGISPDNSSAQKAFDEKFKLGFPLLADEDHKVADAYGVWGERSLYGNKFMGIIRSSFLIDETGTMEEVWYKT